MLETALRKRIPMLGDNGDHGHMGLFWAIDTLGPK